MSKSFLTATALVALLGFGATSAMAQQAAPTLNAPAVEKAAPVQSGKSATGTVKSDSKAATKTTDSKAKRNSANACATIKDKAAHDSCMKSHAASKASKNQSSKTPAAAPAGKTVTPAPVTPAPKVGG